MGGRRGPVSIGETSKIDKNLVREYFQVLQQRAHWMPIKKYNHRSDKYHGCQQRHLIFFLTLTNSSLMSNIRSSNSVLLKDKRVTVIFSSTQLLSTFKIHETCFSGFFCPEAFTANKTEKEREDFPNDSKNPNHLFSH